MKKVTFNTISRTMLADILTPVSVYLRIRTLFPKSVLLESSDYHGNENSWSFICFNPIGCFTVDKGEVTKELPGQEKERFVLSTHRKLHDELDAFFKSFEILQDDTNIPANGLFGYINFDAVRHFENIQFNAPEKEGYQIPEVRYCFYKYIIAIDHHKNQVQISENLMQNESSQLDYIQNLLVNLNFSTGK